MPSIEPTNKTDIATNHFASRRIVDLASHRSVHYTSSPEFLQSNASVTTGRDGSPSRPRAVPLGAVASARRPYLATVRRHWPITLQQQHRLDSAPFVAIENLLQAVMNEK
jgi:hypothetical protein